MKGGDNMRYYDNNRTNIGKEWRFVGIFDDAESFAELIFELAVEKGVDLKKEDVGIFEDGMIDIFCTDEFMEEVKKLKKMKALKDILNNE